MKNDDLQKVTTMMNSRSRKLKIVRRKSASKIKTMTEEESKDFADRAKCDSFFHEHFQTRVEITHGEVFMVNFDYECGNELSGPHFVVAVTNSKEQDPMVTVIPLKSYKGVLNPRSDVKLGIVKGTTTGSESIALINQIKSIDKSRLFEHTTITELKRILNSESLNENDEIEIRNKRVYRLTNSQMRILYTAMNQFLNYGYIQH